MDHWYALHCRSNTERLVAMRLEDAGLEAFYPHLVVQSKDRKRDIERKFFPGYLFARFDLANKTPIAAVPQVVSILGWAGAPVIIPSQEIEAIRVMVQADINPETLQPVPYMSAGDRVLVQRGPLAGLEGYVVYSKSSARVIVSVTMLARSVSAEVDMDSLALVKAA